MRPALRWLPVVAAVLAVACGGPDYIPGGPPEDVPGDWRQTMVDRSGPWTMWGYGTGEAEESIRAGRDRADSMARSDLLDRVARRTGHLKGVLVERLADKGQGSPAKRDIQAVLDRAGEIASNQARIVRRKRDKDGIWHALARTELEPALREAANHRLGPGPAQRLMAAAREVLSPGKGEEGSGE